METYFSPDKLDVLPTEEEETIAALLTTHLITSRRAQQIDQQTHAAPTSKWKSNRMRKP